MCGQALYFRKPVLLEKCQKAQILCIPPLSCKKKYDVIILGDVDRISSNLVPVCFFQCSEPDCYTLMFSLSNITLHKK